MREAKEIVKYLDLEFDSELNRDYYNNIIIKAIQEAQIDAIEATCKRCAEKAEVKTSEMKPLEQGLNIVSFFEVDKDSILNCAEILKKEL